MILVGGVGQLWQGDLDIGRRAAERLACERLGPDVRVEDLYYGAVAVAQLLEEVQPRALVLVGAVGRRDREAGSVEIRRISCSDTDRGRLRSAIADAITGYVSTDLIVAVAAALAVLPPVTLVVEVEPASIGPSEQLTPQGARGLDKAIAAVRREVGELACL